MPPKSKLTFKQLIKIKEYYDKHQKLPDHKKYGYKDQGNFTRAYTSVGARIEKKFILPNYYD